jgi:hypothetical protein
VTEVRVQRIERHLEVRQGLGKAGILGGEFLDLFKGVSADLKEGQRALQILIYPFP